ncbi:hypothetical protein HDU76_000334 [Blyttiomyces sp. JEL0837]|nr:hypothetical protein HDU76_000334 [Blyttiomyces sp. JEL0837]
MKRKADEAGWIDTGSMRKYSKEDVDWAQVYAFTNEQLRLGQRNLLFAQQQQHQLQQAWQPPPPAASEPTPMTYQMIPPTAEPNAESESSFYSTTFIKSIFVIFIIAVVKIPSFASGNQCE